MQRKRNKSSQKQNFKTLIAKLKTKTYKVGGLHGKVDTNKERLKSGLGYEG